MKITLLTELYNVLFRSRATFENARNRFYSDYAGNIMSFRNQGSIAADEQSRAEFSKFTTEEIVDEQMACLEEQESLMRSERRLVSLLTGVGLWNVTLDNLAFIALIVTLILVFCLGFHPFLFLIPIGMIALGIIPYIAISLFCNFRLTGIYYDLGWDERELKHIQHFWEQNPIEESSLDTEASRATTSSP